MDVPIMSPARALYSLRSSRHMSLSVGTRLGAYKVLAQLGSGGMGEVYRAHDTKLRRDVALKILPIETAFGPERLERFRREARAVAALNHPNIVTIYSVEEAEGVHFFTMELVPGQPLNQLIPESGLDIERVLDIAKAIADALVAAHDKGIVHRDLKPANLMITDEGRLKVLDFGLVKVEGPEGPVSVDSELSTEMRTRDGIVMGTMPYMSPEQVQGRDVDHRTDLFSLGVILYEMTTGRRPFQGHSSAELASAILRDAPVPAWSIRSDLPASLQQAIEGCLEKDPAARPQAARDVRSLLAAGGGAVAVRVSAVAGDERSIAVLPLATLSPDPNNDFFADGVTEEILNALAQIPGLRVAGRSSAFSFKGRNEDLRSVGAKLGVATILEGTLRRAGNHLRITAQLIDARTGYQLWSERYDRILEDVFAVQDEIATTIAGRLRLSLERDGQPVRPPTRNLAAYELYLKGRALLYRRGLSILKAVDCFTEAVVLDTAYAQAWAGLADGYTTSGYSGLKPGTEVMPRALEAARRALALDENLAEAHNALACATLLHEIDYALAEREFRRALELNPHYPQARAWYGLFFLHWVAAREKEGRDEILRLLRSDPLSGYAHVILSFSDFTSGRMSEAVEHARRGLELDPDSYLACWCLAISLRCNAQFEQAAVAAERALSMSGRHSWALTTLVTIYAAWQRPDKARATYQELQDRSTGEYVQPSMLAAASAAVGDVDQAIAFSRQALEQKDPQFILLVRSWPDYGPIRTDPRFVEIVEHLHLPGGPSPLSKSLA